MKTPARNFILGGSIALFLALMLPSFAQEKPAPPPGTPSDTPPTATAAPAPATTPTESAAPAPEEKPAQEKSEKSELRRLDLPSDNPASEEAAPADDAEKSSVTEKDESASPTSTPADKSKPRRHKHHFRHDGNERVSFWHDSTLAADESADAVVSIFGSSTAAGDVSDAVVSVFGSSTSSGDVGDAVVSVFGNSRATAGDVGDVVVSVFGTTSVNATVHGPVVAVLGDVELGPDADVNEVVCIGGTVKRDGKAVVRGQVNNVAFGPHFGGFEWLHAWIRHCLVLGRPLAFGAHLMWAWWIALSFLVLYAVLALLFPRGIEKCAQTLEQRPGYSILTALLVTLLTPLAAIILLITIVGTPALLIFLLAAGIFGKAVMMAWIGRRITPLFAGRLPALPVVCVLVGGVTVLLLYTIPFVGFVVSKLLAWLGLGAVVYTIILGSKRKPAATTSAVTLPVVSPVTNVSEVPLSTAETSVPNPAAVPPVVPPQPGPSAAPFVSAVTLVRAGFWIRLAASGLDAIIVGLAFSFTPHLIRPNYLLMYAAYCVVMWALKGTTVGDIVCSLKVVRLDDRPVDWATALVRALGGFLSLFAAGLGFIWVAFDDQKQSWHDKIAGTTVVQVPKGVALV